MSMEQIVPKSPTPHFPSNYGGIPPEDFLATMGLVNLGSHPPFFEALTIYEEAVTAFEAADESTDKITYLAFEVAMKHAYDALLAICDAYTCARIAEAVYLVLHRGQEATNAASNA